MAIDNKDLAIRILDQLVLAGLVKDCTDTDDETEFEFQDTIEEVLNKELPDNKAPE